MRRCQQDFRLLVTGKPALEVAPGEIEFKYRVGEPQPQLQVIHVRSSWPSLPYSLEVVGAPWLQAESAEGVTPDSQSASLGDKVQLKVDAGKLTPGIYHGFIRFSTWRGANVPEVDVVLTIAKPEI